MRRVMIVDDAAFMRLTLKSILEKSDFKVVGEAENGQIAVRRYVELSPDIVTLDITMPGMGGLEALREIRKIDSKAKVIMISAMGQEGYVREAIMCGARSFIVKPFTSEHVVKALTAI